jgi:hypothetical protein
MDTNELQQLQKQMAELTKVVAKERQLRIAAEAARRQAEARLDNTTEEECQQAATATTGPIASRPPVKGPKVAVSDKYNGTRSVKAEVYANQVRLYVISNPTLFPDNCSRIIFSLLYLTGLASTWAQPFTQQLFAGKDITYKEFSTAFQLMYFDTK